MRNFIILNGKNSNEVTGLLISSLPSITKPLIRTNIEEIDGKDGDIVTKLGYAAYDKTFEIGLYGNYDIDEVIAFFNSEGTVTFSNEIDKYYNYQVLEQIDFERLVRFRTATVTMHVQPFKYSTLERLKTYNITNETQVTVRNNGNMTAKPTITIYGTGTINLNLNGYQIFVIELGQDEEYITIDIAREEAYKDSLSTLKNRLVTGNYDNFIFNVGQNIISWSGSITKIQIENYSRWL